MRGALRTVLLLSPIRSLHYFIPLIDEITLIPLDPSWLHYLRQKSSVL